MPHARNIRTSNENLPAANPAYIHVNETRLGIEADSSTVKGESGIPQSCRRNARHADVDGLALHVQTMRCDAGCGAAEKLVAPRCAVTANDVDLGSGPARSGRQIMQQVENARVQLRHVARAVVPQKLIQAIDGGRYVVVW
jgi:hypothetical protein